MDILDIQIQKGSLSLKFENMNFKPVHMKHIKLTFWFLFFTGIVFGAETASGNNNTNLISLVLTILLPIGSNYLLKIFENKNLSSKISSEIDIDEKKIQFLRNYYTIQSEFISQEEAGVLKFEISEQISQIKKDTDQILTHKTLVPVIAKITPTQNLFLTFKQRSFLGWLWKILYYFNVIMLLFVLLGFGINENNEMSKKLFLTNLQDPSIDFVVFFFVCIALLFRQLSLWDYLEKLKKEKAAS